MTSPARLRCRHFRPVAGLLSLLLLLCTALPALSAQAAPTGLAPGDMVRLKIYREPELSGDYQVDERGRSSSPGSVRCR